MQALDLLIYSCPSWLADYTELEDEILRNTTKYRGALGVELVDLTWSCRCGHQGSVFFFFAVLRVDLDASSSSE